MPRDTIVIGYADDTMIVVKAAAEEALQNRTNAALHKIATHIRELGLQLAVEKTEAVAFTYKYKPLTPNIRLAGKRVILQKSLKYLGVKFQNSGTSLYDASQSWR